MQKELQWHSVAYGHHSKNVPKERWGHKLLKINNFILTFGGYGGIRQGQGKFLKDLWKFNLQTYQWEKLVTQGDHPDSRSNYTIHYYKQKNAVVMFGGGTDNKYRFNSIFILDIDKLIWRQVCYQISEEVPWERTYHTSELFQNYLVVFGGEGISNIDLDDTWAFDLTTEKWRRLEPKGQIPLKRRFASSALVGSDFYLIGGCQNYYEQIGDMHKLSLLPLIENRAEDLKWQVVLLNEPILQRWGHSSDVFNGKIYIFAGRINSSTDDSELIQYNCQSGELRMMQYEGRAPQPRRRHGSVLVGDCLLIFGGYNGKYFNDFSFIKLPRKICSQCCDVKIMDKIYSDLQYTQAISNVERSFLSQPYLQVNLEERIVKIPTCIPKLRQKSAYFNYSLKYNQEIDLPVFCRQNIVRIVVSSITGQQLLLWKQQQLDECLQILELLEYLCCLSLIAQMEKYLLLRLNSKNSLKVFQIAIRYQLPELAQASACVYFQSFHTPSENAQENGESTSINLVPQTQSSAINQSMLKILAKVENNIKFQLDQYHLRNSRKGFFSKTLQLFTNIFCSRTQSQPQDHQATSRKKASCLRKVLMGTYRLCFALGGRTPPNM